MTSTSKRVPGPGPRRAATPQRARRSRSGASMRETILDAAREQFAAGGYDGTSVRAIARSAGVDQALVHHYFGSKEKLFAAAVELPAVPGELMEALLDGEREQIAQRWLRAVFSMWEADPVARERLAAVVRSTADGEPQSRMLHDFLTRHMLTRLATALGVDRPELRAALAGSQMIGLFIARMVVGVPPLVDADPEYLVACYAPVLQQTLTGPLPASGPAPDKTDRDGTAPGEAVRGGTARTETAPGETARIESARTETPPGETVPGREAPGGTAPE